MEQSEWRLGLRYDSDYNTVPVSTWEDVEQVLLQLDGINHDDASLEYIAGNIDNACLNVGGGEEKRVVVSIQIPGMDYPLNLFDSVQDKTMMEQSVGGQETPLPGIYYVPLAMALKAARYFYQNRMADPSLQWDPPGFME